MSGCLRNCCPDNPEYALAQENNILILNTKNNKVILRAKLKTKEYEITYIKWLNDSELIISMNDLINNFNGKYKTNDFKNFQFISKLQNEINQWSANNYKKAFFQRENDKKIFIRYISGDIWDTGIAFDFTGFDWSKDDKYLQISNGKDNYLIDTEIKKVSKFNKDFSGQWAPTRNIYAFYTGTFSDGYDKNSLYLFNPNVLSFIKVNLQGIDHIRTFLWSPDSKFLLVDTIDEIFLIDIAAPFAEPKRLLKLEGSILEDRITWSKDLNSVLACYQVTTRNIFKPKDFFVVKANVQTGNIKKIYIDGLLYGKYFWIDDNVFVYEIDHRIGLYKAVLKW